MIRILLTKYWVLAHLLVTAGTLCFNPMPSVGMALWCAVSLLLMLLCLPPVFKGESYWLARQRVTLAMRGDAVFWMALVALAYVGMQLLNGPRTLEYASELKRWVFSAPPVRCFPSSITPCAGIPWLTGLISGLAIAVAVRCALPRKQRLVALMGMGMLSGVLALWGVVATLVTGQVPAFEWLGGTYDAGMLWFLFGCVSLGIVGEAFLESHSRTMGIAFAVAFLNVFGAVAFGAVFPAVLTMLLVLGWTAFALIAVQASGRPLRFFWRSVLLLPLFFAVGFGLILSPGAEVVRPELQVSQWSEALQQFWAQWTFRADVAMDVFTSHPMLGAGPDGFAQYGRFFVKGALEWSYWKSGGGHLPCDFLLLLTSCGMMGTLLLLLPGGAMLGRCLMRWVEYRQGVRRHYSLRYIVVFAGSFVGVIGMFLASCFGTPLHSPAVLGGFLLVCACMGGWMPRLR